MATIRKKLNVHPSKIFYTYLYPLYAKEFLFGDSYQEFIELIEEDFILTVRQKNAIETAWEEKEEIIST
jgi:hypothetical protein